MFCEELVAADGDIEPEYEPDYDQQDEPEFEQRRAA